MQIIQILAILLSFILSIAMILGLILYIRDAVIARVPFVSSRTKVIPEIIKALNLQENSVVYDLGCGNGSILRAIRHKYPKVRLIGIEFGTIPYIIARFLSIGRGIEIRFEDMYTTNIHDATHFYLYTGTEAMNKFEKKIFKECNIGTRIVAMDFVFKDIPSIECIELPKSLLGLCKNIYVYEINNSNKV